MKKKKKSGRVAEKNRHTDKRDNYDEDEDGRTGEGGGGGEWTKLLLNEAKNFHLNGFEKLMICKTFRNII